jgi:hypothetical protein
MTQTRVEIGRTRCERAAARAASVGRILCAVALGCALAEPAAAYDLDPGPGSHGGTVFRQDEIEARDFDYSDEHMGQVLAFRHTLDATMDWKQWRADVRRAPYGGAYRITVGSLTNEDFYLEQEAFGSLATLEGRLRLRYRLVVDEDFDSRYVRNLVEADVRIYEGLFAGVSAELHADKEFIDFGLALGYEHERFLLRLDAVFAELTFNDKSAEDARFRRYPRTFIARAEARPTDELSLGMFAEVSTPLELESFERRFRFGMVKDRVGLYALWQDDGLALGLEVGFERAHKRRFDQGGSPLGGDLDVERKALFADLRARLSLDDERRVSLDLGAHVVRLDETADATDPGASTFDDRAEVYGSVGLHLLPELAGDLDRSFAITPTLYVGLADVADETESRRHLVVNLAPRIEALPRERLRIVLNPMMHLHDLTFGGGNVQVVFAF